MAACIDLMTRTMASVSQGRAELPLRTVMPVSRDGRMLGVMPGYLGEPDVVGAKLVCLFPGNAVGGLSSHTGIVTLFSPQTGQIMALLDGAEVTALRTPAATAAASRVLARRDASDMAVLGTGEQALGHLEALSIAHPGLKRIRLWGRDRAKAGALAQKAQAGCAVRIEVIDTVQKTVEGADIICTVTGAQDPVLKGAWIIKGAHVNLVGASVPSKSEIDVEGVAMGRYFVDYRPSALAQAGELKRAMEAGLVTQAHIIGEIGAVHLGLCAGRTSDEEITIYKSLGIAAQDLAAANAVLAAAQRDDLGVKVSM